MNFDLRDYVELIERYCRARCFSSDEAQDMAQEILLRAWSNRERICAAEHPGKYLMGIARHVYVSMLRKARFERAHSVCCDFDETFGGCRFPAVDRGEEYERLRRLIINLSREYREIILAYYFSGKSVREIANMTGIPEGTVKWRLKTARDDMKKEWNDMDRTYNPLVPGRVEIIISGHKPERDIVPELTTPTRCLLLLTLEKPMSVREIAERTQIPTMLAEEELDGLVELEAVKRGGDGRFATDFFIEPLDYLRELRQISDRYAADLRPGMILKMQALREEMLAIGFSLGGHSYEEALPVLLMHMLHEGICQLPQMEGYAPPLRKDGTNYYFKARVYENAPTGLKIQDWYNGIPGLSYLSCVPGRQPVMEMIGAVDTEVIAFCKQLKEQRTTTGYSDDFVARMHEAGLIARDQTGFYVAVPWFTKDQYAAFSACGKRLINDMSAGIDAFIGDVRRLVSRYIPARLAGQTQIHVIWSAFDLMAELMDGIWPENACAAYGLMFVER